MLAENEAVALVQLVNYQLMHDFPPEQDIVMMEIEGEAPINGG